MLDDRDEDSLQRERERCREAKRASRRRARLGLEQYEIELPRNRLIEAILNSERLTAAEALDHAKVEAEITKILIEWIGRWEKVTA